MLVVILLLKAKRISYGDGTAICIPENGLLDKPIGDKVSKADYVVWTDGGFDETDRQVDEIYRRLTTLASPAP